MTAIRYRMNAGVAGDVTRTHPASIMPRLNDDTNPVLLTGMACMFDNSANSVRQMATGDNSATAIAIAGFAVRSFPFQASTSTAFGGAAYGAPTPPAGAIDVLQSGSIMVLTNGTPGLGDPVYIWCAADSGAHVQGYAEASATGGSTALLGSAYFNGPPDENGLCEVVINVP